MGRALVALAVTTYRFQISDCQFWTFSVVCDSISILKHHVIESNFSGRNVLELSIHYRSKVRLGGQ